MTLSDNEKTENGGNELRTISRYLELFIVGTLSVAGAVIFFNAPRDTRAFGEAGLVALLLWAIYHKRKPVNPIPKFVIVMSVLYILSYVVNFFMSPDPDWEHVNIRKYIYLIISGFLFAFPLNDKYRRFMIVVFFGSAAIAGAAGILQIFRWGIIYRAQGFSGNPLHYAGLLGFVCCTAAFLLFARRRNIFESGRGILFLLIVTVLTFLGILFSMSRGVWIAMFVAGITTLFLYNRRIALISSLCAIVMLSLTFYFNIYLKDKAASIATSFYTENERGSTGTRMELWKGALLIFKESPLLGVGTGNFESHINELIREGKLKDIPVKMHAHNIFLQALATRGTVGIITTLGLFIAMIRWGWEEIQNNRGVGGYVIILSTVYTIIAGLTENNIEFTKYLTDYCFIIGLIGTPWNSRHECFRQCSADELKL